MEPVFGEHFVNVFVEIVKTFERPKQFGSPELLDNFKQPGKFELSARIKCVERSKFLDNSDQPAQKERPLGGASL